MIFAADLKAACDIAAEAARYTQLRRVGPHELRGPCPVHGGKNPDAFRLRTDRQTWCCFTRCGRGGDLLDLVAACEGVGFVQACRIVADRNGLSSETPQAAVYNRGVELRMAQSELAAFDRYLSLRRALVHDALRSIRTDIGACLYWIERLPRLTPSEAAIRDAQRRAELAPAELVVGCRGDQRTTLAAAAGRAPKQAAEIGSHLDRLHSALNQAQQHECLLEAQLDELELRPERIRDVFLRAYYSIPEVREACA